MNELIDTLQAQHRVLLGIIATIDAALAASDGPAVSANLDAFVDTLRRHLAIEDARLYPELGRFAGAHDAAEELRIAAVSAESMARISESLSRFVARHSVPAPDLAAVAAEWPLVRDALKSRISAEESTLYRAYLALLAQAD